jgi:hypothetical protein
MYYIVTYANKNFINSLDYLEKSLCNYNVKLLKYTEKNLPTSFKIKNKKHFRVKRGGGYWVWKPFVILDALSKINDNDMLLYLDSGLSAIRDVKILFEYFNKMNQDIILFQNHGLQNQVWTKRDCFVLMDCDNENYYYKEQINAAIQLYRKTTNSSQFLTQYLHYCTNYDIISDAKSKLKSDFVSFIENRHDQSILTNLSIKYNIKTFRNPTQFGNHLLDNDFTDDQTVYTYDLIKFIQPFSNSHYPQIFDHHRKRFNYKDSYIKKIALKIVRFLK